MNINDMTEEQTQAVHELMISPTMSRLAELAQSMPSVTNKDELKAAFSTTTMDLIRALDNERVHFDDWHDKAMLYGLLTVSVDFILDGRLKTGAVAARMN
jgi:hypothetical protein